MASASPSGLLEALNWRYATKKFDPTKTIPPETWAALEHALVLTPSSAGLQPWKFVVVTDAAVKARLVPASHRQAQPADCSHFVVFTVRRGIDHAHVDRHVARTAEVREVEVASLARYRQMITSNLDKARGEGTLDTWQQHQVYIALGSFITAAAMLGVDTCPMEGIEPDKFDEILGLTGTGYTTVVACAAGYRAADDKYAATKKVRFNAHEVIVRI
ncbi:MAG TPA: NAD(P)H-dependent oxidoreductase [Opitutaceae bacterium]|nr:NAD(P)H-dependent oxidoreductase [Opitutaceae bacterium]